jgi:hypothetical protein
MIDLQEKLAQLTSIPGELSERAAQAVLYRDLLSRGEISAAEYQDLLADLKRLDDIQLSAAELSNQIVFDQLVTLLSNIPIS